MPIMIALTTEGVKDIEHQLNTVSLESFKTDLKGHKVKTTSMTNIDSTHNTQIEGTETGKSTDYKYLGQTIPLENRTRYKVSKKTKQDGVFL